MSKLKLLEERIMDLSAEVDSLRAANAELVGQLRAEKERYAQLEMGIYNSTHDRTRPAAPRRQGGDVSIEINWKSRERYLWGSTEVAQHA